MATSNWTIVKNKPIEQTTFHSIKYTQPAITDSNLTIETLDQGVKYVQSYP